MAPVTNCCPARGTFGGRHLRILRLRERHSTTTSAVPIAKLASTSSQGPKSGPILEHATVRSTMPLRSPRKLTPELLGQSGPALPTTEGGFFLPKATMITKEPTADPAALLYGTADRSPEPQRASWSNRLDMSHCAPSLGIRVTPSQRLTKSSAMRSPAAGAAGF